MDNISGSQIAKKGFANEKEIADKFIHWQYDNEAKKWLEAMGYSLKNIDCVSAEILSGYKTDIQVCVKMKSSDIINTQNLQIKLVSSAKGFNQIDKRWVAKYSKMWDMPENIEKLLKYYTGEIAPYKSGTKDNRRMFMTEFSLKEQQQILDWFQKNKMLIVSDIVKGRGNYSAEWILVAQKYDNVVRWILKPINVAINHYSKGKIKITNKGSLKIGRITMQRKGGDSGRETANMLQFKVNPVELFDE